jgi:hypothetical protein
MTDEGGSDEDDKTQDRGTPSFAPPSFGEADEASLEGLRVDAWLVRRWLKREVALSPRDQETLAILLEHARVAKSYRRIAEERGMTQGALAARVFEFKQRYVDRYEQRRDRTLLWIVLAVLVPAVAAVWWWLASRA